MIAALDIDARRLPRREIDRKRGVFLNYAALVAGMLIGAGLMFLLMKMGAPCHN